MKKQVVVAAYLEKGKGKKVAGQRNDLLILASAELSEVRQVRPCHRVEIDRTEETKLKELSEAAVSDYIASLNLDKETKIRLVHKTLAHGTSFREQRAMMGFVRAPVMAPDPATMEVRNGVLAAAEGRKIEVQAGLPVSGAALKEAHDFFGRLKFNIVDAAEKRALMMAFGIRTGNSAQVIETLTKRLDRIAAREQKVAVAARKLRLA